MSVKRKPFGDTVYARNLRTQAREWAPTVEFATPGTSTFTYSAQFGHYWLFGNLAFININMQFTPTIGTGSSSLYVKLPFNTDPSSNWSLYVGTISGAFNWPAGYTSVNALAVGGDDNILIRLFGDNVTQTSISASHLTDGLSHTLTITGMLPVVIND